jgi:hypothetical protein
MSLSLYTAPRPKAFSHKIDDLMRMVRRGVIRIPHFQRPYRWGASDRLLLLDSIWRGFPAGMLLLWKHPAKAQPVRLGPLTFDADANNEALWVVDGQQRLSTLAACLLVRPYDAAFRSFATYFDLDKREFVGHSAAGRGGPRWLPIHRAFDPNDCQEWALEHVARDPERRSLAFQVGTALRDFEIPAIVVESDDERQLRQIFDRVNTAGRRLRRDEVFRALHEGFGGASPDTVASVAREVAELGSGTLPVTWVQRTAEVLAGIDPTRKRNAMDRDPGRHSEILKATLDPLRRTVEFLIDDAHVVRTELVPHYWVVPILARIFQRFPDLHERNRALLARWLWRGALSGRHSANNSPAFRSMIRAASRSTESDSVQALLELVPRDREAAGALPSACQLISTPLRGLHAGARMAICAFMSARPLDLDASDTAFELSRLLPEETDGAQEPTAAEDPAKLLLAALLRAPRLVEPARGVSSPGLASIANLVLVERTSPIVDEHGLVILDRLAQLGATELGRNLLDGHAFTAQAIAAIQAGGDGAGVLAARMLELERRALQFFEARARWGDPDLDRPPMATLQGDLDEEPPE